MEVHKNEYTKNERQQWINILAKSSSRELEDVWQGMAEKYKDRQDKLNCYIKARDQIKAYVMTLPEILMNGD